MSPEFYTIDEIAEVLKVNRKTVERLIHDKKLEAIKFGKQYRIEDKSFKGFIADHSTVGETIEPEILYNRPEKAQDDDQA